MEEREGGMKRESGGRGKEERNVGMERNGEREREGGEGDG